MGKYYSEIENIANWSDYFSSFFKIKDNPRRLVAKIVDRETGLLQKSVVMPTDYYPLHNENFKVFTKDNSAQITDKKILKIFNSVEYRTGRCYTMADELKEKLVDAGFNAKIYTGWLFVASDDKPVHHAWVVIDNSVLDLSDHYYVLWNLNGDKFQNKTTEEQRELMAEFTYATQSWSNEQRCFPVGVPSDMLFYIGCEVDCANEGRIIYNRMIKQFPDHHCQGVTKTQQIVFDRLGVKY